MENINLIRKISHQFAKKQNKVPYEELFAEASLAYAEALNNFDDTKKCKLTTYAWTCMYNHLLFVSQKNTYFNPRTNKMVYKDLHPQISIENIENPDAILPTVSIQDDIQDWLNSLPDDCQKLANIVLENPEKWLNENTNFHKKGPVKKHLANHLRNEGWKWQRIWDAFKEMKTAVNAL